MAGEKYIERLQRERKELIDYAKSVRDWTDAIYHHNHTGRKGSAKQEVLRTEAIEREKFKIIEPYLAD